MTFAINVKIKEAEEETHLGRFLIFLCESCSYSLVHAVFKKEKTYLGLLVTVMFNTSAACKDICPLDILVVKSHRIF